MEISRSKWDNFIKCPLCFYLKEKHNIDPPSTPRFTINMRVDNLLKEEFDELRVKGEPHPIFKEYNLNFVPYNGLSPETLKNIDTIVVEQELHQKNRYRNFWCYR